MELLKMCARPLLAALVPVMVLSGCGGGNGRRVKVEEVNPLNVTAEVTPSAISGVELYYDAANDMEEISKQARFEDIVEAAYDVSSAIAVSYNNDIQEEQPKKNKRDEEETQSGCILKLCTSNKGNVTIESCGSAEFLSYVRGEGEYSAESSMMFSKIIPEISDDKLTVMVTDLASQIDYDYISIGNDVVENLLKKDMAVAYVCVYDKAADINAKPYFIVAAGNNDVVSEFVTQFNNNRTIAEISRPDISVFEENKTTTINCEIFANHAGINGINYSGIEFQENGIVYEKNEDGSYKRDEKGQFVTVVDPSGSFTKYKADFTGEKEEKDGILMYRVEGTVNFNPAISNVDSESKMLVKYKIDKKSGSGNRASASDVRYLACEPLVPEGDGGEDYSNVAGKLKMQIPFNMIEGVRMSLMECDLNTELYYVDTNSKNSGEFVQAQTNPFEVSIAEGVEEIQGRWRIDDATNSLTLNIVAKNLQDLFNKVKADTQFLKLNVNFTHYKSKAFLPMWVTDLSKSSNENSKVENLQKLFDYIYDYQSENDNASNGFTIYIKNPNASNDERGTRE